MKGLGLGLMLLADIEQLRHKLADVRPHIHQQIGNGFRRQSYTLALPISGKFIKKLGVVMLYRRVKHIQQVFQAGGII